MPLIFVIVAVPSSPPCVCPACREASVDLGKALKLRPNDIMLRKESAVLKVGEISIVRDLWGSWLHGLRARERG